MDGEFAKDESSILSTSILQFLKVKKPSAIPDFHYRDAGKPPGLSKRGRWKDGMAEGFLASKGCKMEVATSNWLDAQRIQPLFYNL